MRRRRARPAEFDEIDLKEPGDCEAVEALKLKLYAETPRRNLPAAATDFMVRVGDYLWEFHKDTFAAKSDYFRVLTTSTFLEVNQGLIDLSEDEPQLVARLFIWVYTGSYPVNTYLWPEPGVKSIIQACKDAWQKDKKDFVEPLWIDGHALLHLNMVVLADYYIVPDMQAYALRKFESSLRHDSSKQVFDCFEALEAVENLPKATLDLVVTPLVSIAKYREFTMHQKTKIKALATTFPALTHIVYAPETTKMRRSGAETEKVRGC